MSKRIRQLEEALGAVHPSHPLLKASSSLDAVGTVDDTHREGATNHIDSDDKADRSAKKDRTTTLDSNIMNAFGELAISDCKDPAVGPREAEVCYLRMSTL